MSQSCRNSRLLQAPLSGGGGDGCGGIEGGGGGGGTALCSLFIINFIKLMRPCKHPHRPQSHSVENLFAPLF